MPAAVVLDVDTGTDDAGALLLAATCAEYQLVGATATWGNTTSSQAARNTLAVLVSAGRGDVPVHIGASVPVAAAPTTRDARRMMGSDGLGDLGLADRVLAGEQASDEPAAEAIVRLASQRPGDLTLVAVAPLSTVAAALELDPELPGRLAGLTVMGGAIACGGNLTPAAESNIGHDPTAAARVVEAFGQPDALAGGVPPRLVPLDATLAGALTTTELDALKRSSLPGAGLLSEVWEEIWPRGQYETGDAGGRWPAHDLLATLAVTDPDVCHWQCLPLAVDTGGSAAWGATVADRRVGRGTPWTARWDVAVGVDVDRFHAAVRAWLAGGY